MKYLAFSLVSKEKDPPYEERFLKSKTIHMKRGRGVKIVLKSNIYIKKKSIAKTRTYSQ